MQELRETIVRGTPDFPLALYHYRIKSANYRTFAPHWHPEIEILYITKGEFLITAADEKLLLKAGDICFINPEELHVLFTSTVSCEYSALVFSSSLIGFSSDHFFSEQFLTPLMKGRIRFPRVLSAEHSHYKEILPIIDSLFRSNGSRLMCLANLTTLFCAFLDYSIMESNLTNHNNRRNENIKLCLDYMSKHYNEKINLTTLADLLHMTPNYFCNYFKRCTGSTPINHLISLKIKKAISLLSQTNDSIANISELCGFENMSFFIKKFKEYTGYTPSAYRKKLQEQNNVQHNTKDVSASVLRPFKYEIVYPSQPSSEIVKPEEWLMP